MKRILICLLCAVLAAGAAAQGHLEFQGVPVGGSVEACMKALRKQKFKPDGPSKMRGKYRGDDVTLTLGTSPASGEVCLLLLTYGQAGNWQALRNQYDTAKMMLGSEYGRPSLCKESFDYPYSEKDGLRAVEHGKCHFTTVWTSDAGEITLDIARSGQLQIFFSDKAGMGGKD